MPPRMFWASGSRSESAPLPLAVITTGACKQRRKPAQLVPGAAAQHAAAGPDQAAAARSRGGCAACSSASGSPADRSGRSAGGEQLDVRGREEGVRRDLDLDRPLAATPHRGEGPLHQTRDFRRRGGTLGLLRHGADHAQLVRNLVQKPATELDEVGLDLPRHAQDRGIAGVGGRERGRGIEESRTGDDHAGADFAGGARVAIGHVRGGLLVAGVDDADARSAARRARQTRRRAGHPVARRWYRRRWRSTKRPAPDRRSIRRVDVSVAVTSFSVARPFPRLDHQSILSRKPPARTAQFRSTSARYSVIVVG